jgi:hypothetical protein
MPRYCFGTVTFKTVEFDIPDPATVGDARKQAARQWKCDPRSILVLQGGRALGDDERLPVSLRFGPAVIYKKPAFSAGNVRSDPPDFGEIVEGIMAMALGHDRETVQQILREANYDTDIAVDRLMAKSVETKAPSSDSIPQPIMDTLMSRKPAHMSKEDAIQIYLELCGGDIEAALKILSD